MDFGLDLQGSDAKVILRFQQFPRDVHDRLLLAMRSIEQRLEVAVVAGEPARTGALRQLTGGRVYDHDTRIAAVVGVRATSPNEAKKAAALEYGSSKPLTVRAHEASLAHVYSRAIAPITVQIGAHARTPNIDPFRFLRGPPQAIRSQAIADMRAAVDQAVQGSNE